MHLKSHILLMMCLLAGMTAIGQEPQKSPLAIVDAGNGELEVHFEMPGIFLKSVGGGFLELVCDGMVLGNGSVGSPDLPSLSTLLHLPEGNILTVGELDGNEESYEGWLIFGEDNIPLTPVTEGWFKDREQPGYEPDSSLYATDGWYRTGEPVEVEHLGRMGHEEIYRLTVHPVAYNPVRGDLQVWERINGRLKVESGKNPPLAPHLSSLSSHLLIVSRPEFREGLQPFVTWKRQEGFEVDEFYVDTHQRDSVKARLSEWYAGIPACGKPSILIVGDATQIQAFIGQTNVNGETHITDLYYGDFTGDYLPEAMVGRWPVNDTAELHTVVAKTLRYEQFTDMDASQLRRLLAVAGSENTTPAPVTTNGQVRYVSREAKLAHSEMDTLCYRNPASADQLEDIKADIGQGLGLLNYTAHCTVGGWTSPALSATGVEQAGASQPTVFVNNCCKSNDFGGTGFGEQLLRMPMGGAVGVIGATNSTLWNEDYYWAVGPKYPLSLDPSYNDNARGAFDALTGHRRTAATLGELLTAGNLAVTAFGTSYDRLYWEIYCLLGDPTLRPWIGTPEQAELQLANGLTNGESEILATATPGATVTVLQDNELTGCAVADTAGFVRIPLRRTLGTHPVVITASGVNLIPQVDTVAVDTVVEHGATLRNVVVTDNMVSCTVENIGLQRYDSLRVTLTTPDGETDGAQLEEQFVVVDSLLPHGQASVTLPVNVLAIGQHPFWQATLSLWSDSIECRLYLTHNLSISYPTLTLQLLDSTGREARFLMPNQSYIIEATVDGPFDSLSLSVNDQSTLTSHLSPFTFHLSPLTSPLCALHLTATLFYDHWRQTTDHWIEPGQRHDGFENGFDGHPWDRSARVPWVVDSTVSHSGRFSVRSGAIDHGQQSDLCIDVFLPHDDTLGYWVKASTEARYDKLLFLIDGVRVQPDMWGEHDWSHQRRNIRAGRHTLCWRYAKDAATSEGSDCVWLDDIHLPLALWDNHSDWECVTSDTTAAIPNSQLSIHNPQLSVFPNPSHGEVTISVSEPSLVTIIDITGREIQRINLSTYQRINLSTLSPGLYFVSANHHHVKLIIQ